MGGKPSSGLGPGSDEFSSGDCPPWVAAGLGPPPPPPEASTGPNVPNAQRAAFEAWLVERFPPGSACTGGSSGGNGAGTTPVPPSDTDDGRRFQGLENFGATCYANSVLQALYNTPLRTELVDWALERSKRKKVSSPTTPGTGTASADAPTVASLASLFGQMSSAKKRSGVVAPRDFLARVREAAPQFAGPQHQDAQEFLIFLLNACHDELVAERRAQAEQAREQDQLQREKEEQKKKKPKPARAQSLLTKMAPPNIFIPPNSSASSTNASHSSSVSGSPGPSGLGESSLLPPPSPLPSAFINESLPAGAVGVGGGTLFTASTRPPLHTPPSQHLPEPNHSILLQSLHALQQAPTNSLPSSLGLGSRSSTLDSTSFPLPPPSIAPSPAAPVSLIAPTPTEAPAAPPAPTFVQALFEGELTSLIRCLCCSSVSARREAFFDLSLETAPESSLTSALRAFSSREPLTADEKYACAVCACKQEAVRSLHVSRFPRVLVAHLKRFRFDTEGRCTKLAHRVAFPMDLSLKPDQAAAACPEGSRPAEPRKTYELTAVVVHIGSGLRHGHYVCLVRVLGAWLCFDDDDVHAWSAQDVQTVFGSHHTADKNGHHDGYLLFYSQTGQEAD